jgi:hypothetical protein
MHEALSVKERAGEAVFCSFSLTDACFPDDWLKPHQRFSGVDVRSARN